MNMKIFYIECIPSRRPADGRAYIASVYCKFHYQWKFVIKFQAFFMVDKPLVGQPWTVAEEAMVAAVAALTAIAIPATTTITIK